MDHIILSKLAEDMDVIFYYGGFTVRLENSSLVAEYIGGELKEGEEPELVLNLISWEEDGEPYYGVVPTINFPSITVDSECSYSDHCEFVLARWERLARCVTEACRYFLAAHDMEEAMYED